MLQSFHCTLVVLALCFLTSCVSVDKLVESGNYDQAIQVARRHLVGKQNKNPRYVAAIEAAFDKVQAQDLALASRLKADGNPAHWGKINEAYTRIRRRQEALAPLLPLIDKHGMQATFRFVKVDELERDSREQAATYHYSEGRRLLDRGRAGDKAAARSAYRELDNANGYITNYRDVRELKEEAHRLGIVHVLVSVQNQSQVILPSGFERELLQLQTGPMNQEWRQFHLQRTPNMRYDYRAELAIVGLDVSPEVVQTRDYEESKEIEDGFEYVLDERGNVLKDSLGNDIKVPRKVIIRAFVFETLQRKTALVRGQMNLYEIGSGALVLTKDLTAEAEFENYAATFRGDERALTRDTRKRIGNSPIPFPADELLILQAANQLKPILQQQLVRSARVI